MRIESGGLVKFKGNWTGACPEYCGRHADCSDPPPDANPLPGTKWDFEGWFDMEFVSDGNISHPWRDPVKRVAMFKITHDNGRVSYGWRFAKGTKHGH